MAAIVKHLLEHLLFAAVMAAICAHDDNMVYFKGSENMTFDTLTMWIAGSEIEHYVGE